MRKEIYISIIEALSSLNEIKHIDLWNRQVEFLEQENPFPRPAVFVEFGQVDWTQLKNGTLSWEGRGTVNLHIVTDWNGSAAAGSSTMEDNLAGWELSKTIQDKIEGLNGDNFGRLALSSSITNHDHEDLVENIEVYRYRGYRKFEAE